MAIKINNTTVVDNSLGLNNIASVDATTVATFEAAGVGGGDSFKPVAVSGATQALDVGSYNFFNAGPLTTDATVSFTSVPTNARWSYSFEQGFSGGAWNISAAAYLQKFSIANQETAPEGLFFKPDGTKMYVVGTSNQNVNEYDLSTAWDISTASLTSTFSVSAQDGDPVSLFFKPDGTKMYFAGRGGDDVNEYNLSTAWDISTASYLQNFYVGDRDTIPYGLFFKPDGTKMYIAGDQDNAILEYALSTAWNITTASYSHNLSIGSQDTTPEDIFFKPDGTKMYLLGSTGDSVNEYDLSTAWDISTASHLQIFYVGNQDTAPTSVFFKTDGTKMYILGDTGADINEYDIGTLSILTLPASIENLPVETFGYGERVTYDFFTMDGGTTVHLIGEEVIA
jgi:DNA-binding beta-propeller fold protein YncE